jgi:LPS sulfotransferase NodH
MRMIGRLYTKDGDFPLTQDAPRVEYMLATIPRSGSTFFATELWRTGMLGAPMEYLNPIYVRSLVSRDDFCGKDIIDYWYWVKSHRTSPNGVFGYKMFPTNYVRIRDKVPDWLNHIRPDKVVLLMRSDTILHAVSYSRAIRSRSWFFDIKAAPAEYDFDHIHMCVEMIESQCQFWRDLFQLTGTQVYTVMYEDILGDLNGVIEGTARFLGMQYRYHKDVSPALFRIQRDSQSEEWKQRYLRDREAAPQNRSTSIALS